MEYRNSVYIYIERERERERERENTATFLVMFQINVYFHAATTTSLVSESEVFQM